MLKFLKKLFGFDKPTMTEAGVQLEQAPYKIEAPVAVGADITPPVVEPVVLVAAVENRTPATTKAKRPPRGPKTPRSQSAPNPAQGKQPARRGRKPKSQ